MMLAATKSSRDLYARDLLAFREGTDDERPRHKTESEFPFKCTRCYGILWLWIARKLMTNVPTTRPGQKVGLVALPYLNLISRRQPIAFGSYDLWSNTRENWMRILGVDGTGLMAMYRNAHAQPVNAHAAVLTRRDHAQFELEESRRVVEALVNSRLVVGLSGRR